jgi:hypothetical protein
MPRRRGQPADKLGDHGGIDAPSEIGEPPRLVAGEGQSELKAVIARIEREQLIAEDHILESPRREQQQCPYVRHHRRPVAQHRHQRHDARAAAKQQQRTTVVDVPNEMPANRTAQLDCIANSATSWKKGETSPSSSRSMASSMRAVSSGAEAMELLRYAR